MADMIVSLAMSLDDRDLRVLIAAARDVLKPADIKLLGEALKQQAERLVADDAVCRERIRHAGNEIVWAALDARRELGE